MIMQAYKYDTKISKTGQIKLPLSNQLYDKEVEIIIVPKQEIRSNQMKASDFIDKWTGFLSNADTDDFKYRYLTDKYK